MMMFVVHFDIPDYLINELGPAIEQATAEHAEREVRLNGGIPDSRYEYHVSMLPDNPKGKTNFSRLHLEMSFDAPRGFKDWKAVRYPSREDYEFQLEHRGA